jgi:hypothetical protein
MDHPFDSMIIQLPGGEAVAAGLTLSAAWRPSMRRRRASACDTPWSTHTIILAL